MTFAKAAALAAFVAVVLSGSGALAQEPENTVGCLHMSKQVADALAANPQSANYKDAVDQQKAGRQFCMSNVFDIGIAHYEKALDLLGAAKP